MAQSAIQLYTLRGVDTPLPELLTRISDAGFEGVEYANRIRDTDIDAMMAALDETGLESVAAHVDFDRLEDDLDETIEFYQSLGCDHLVVPWLDPEHFETTETIETVADRLMTMAETLTDRGITFSYHNHDHEFREVDGQPAFDRLVAATAEPLGFEIDCGWAAVAGANPVSMLDRWENRVSLVHISDADETHSSVEVGNGVLDVSAYASAVHEHGVEWAIYEHDEPTEPMKSVPHGAEILGRF